MVYNFEKKSNINLGDSDNNKTPEKHEIGKIRFNWTENLEAGI